jgi:FG-GAP repeat protein
MNQRSGRAGFRGIERRRGLSAMRSGVAAAICWTAAASAGFGQGLLFQVNGDASYSGFGAFIGPAGDVNADGFPDLLVGIPYEPKGKIIPGNARVFSGKDGALLHSKFGSIDGELFGLGIAGGFDMNQDGYADFLVGAPGSTYGSALRARLYSGKDLSILWSADGDASDDSFGYAVANCGDVDQDGANDWVVGAPSAVVAGARVGFVRVFSGSSGTALYTVYGSDANAEFGLAVSGAGDVDGDGFDDVLVSSPYSRASPFGGRVQVYSGKTSTLILDELNNSSYAPFFGWSVSWAGDLDLDGFDDVMVGTFDYQVDSCPSGKGFACVYSGQTGATLDQYQGDADNDVFGISVHGCGDVNHDGWSDFIIGAPAIPNTPIFGCNIGPSYARLYSGRTGIPLYNFAGGGPTSEFGYAVSDAGDVNLDGFPDVAVGSSNENGGTVDVFAGNDLYLSAIPTRVAAGDVLTLSTREGPVGNLVATFLVEVNGTPMSTLLRLGTFDSTLGYAFSGTVPTGLSSYDFTFQSFAIGPSGKVIDSAPVVVTIQ